MGWAYFVRHNDDHEESGSCDSTDPDALIADLAVEVAGLLPEGVDPQHLPWVKREGGAGMPLCL